MNPRNLTREAIEELNDIEPYCFETDREEQWFNIGLQYGLDVADSDPISPWISIEDDLPCNHEELVIDNPLYKRTKSVVCNKPCGIRVDQMVYDMELNGWYWTGETPTHWFSVPTLPKEQEIKLWKEKKKDNYIDKNTFFQSLQRV